MPGYLRISYTQERAFQFSKAGAAYFSVEIGSDDGSDSLILRLQHSDGR